MPKLESGADTKYMLQLPTVSFRVVQDDVAPAGIHSEQMRSYGYNDFSEFERPEFYIRHIEPIESELAVQVEYDMDEQDQEWLDAVNAERKKDQSGPISYEVFEVIMDKLEKEWFNLIKRIPQPASHLPVEDSRCAICDDGEGENSNAIVFCDGCNLAVHQDCYGVPYIPEGQWLCRKCTVSPENPVSCLFCPNEGGAFKQTTTGHWAHLLCAIWIPELSVGNAIYMEPVQDVEMLPKSRWKLVCSICREKVGACIQCDNKTCFTAFHVTCARQYGLLKTVKSLGAEGTMRAYCEKHLPFDMRQSQDSDDNDSSFSETEQPASRKRKRKTSHSAGGGAQIKAVTTKSARAHAKSYRPGPPIVPHMIVNKLLEYVAKLAIRKRHPFIERLCRYWSLKREARRGAPLLKRLHLEPWTASSASKEQTDAEKATKLKFLTMLRSDLDKVRMLAELARKREKEKLRQSTLIKEIIDSFLFPHDGRLRLTLEKISSMDRQDLFLNPVNRDQVPPDYFDVIKEPRNWLYIDGKLERNEYRNVADFKRDIQLVLQNAMLYNSADTIFHKTAKRIEANARPLLDELDNITAQSRFTLPGTTEERKEETKLDEEDSDVGDLEASQILLQALVTPALGDTFQDNIGGIFASELPRPKSPTPPPPTPPPKKPRKSQVDKWKERNAAYQERALAGRSTRGAAALISNFTAEAGLVSAEENTSVETPSAPSRRTGRVRGGPTTASSGSKAHSGGSSQSGPDGLRMPSKPQRGVVGIQTFETISDKERRRMEKGLDVVTEDVGAQDSFKRFNVGWVLPEGSKRRRAEPPSTSSAGMSSFRALQITIPGGSAESTENKLKSTNASSSSRRESLPPIQTQAESLQGEDELSAGSLTPLSSSTPIRTAPSGAADAAAKRRKRGAAPSVHDESVEEEIPSSRQRRRSGVAIPSAVAKGKGKGKARSEPEAEAEAEPDLPPPSPSSSELSESDLIVDEEMQEQPVASERAKRERGRAVDVDEGEGNGGAEYLDGTLVWAKARSYPYFAARIQDIANERPTLIDAVLEAEVEARKQVPEGVRLYLVQFFDAQATYGWIPETKLDLFDVDEKIDAMYLAGKEKGKSRVAKPGMKAAVKKGYRLAIDSKYGMQEAEEGAPQ